MHTYGSLLVKRSSKGKYDQSTNIKKREREREKKVIFMSQIISVFRFILSPFLFLWKSSLSSLQKMTKSCAQFVKIDTAASSTINHDEQRSFTGKEGEKFTREMRKGSMNDTLRHSSQRFLQKLRNISLNSITAKNDTSKVNETFTATSKDIPIARQYSAQPMDRPILRVSFYG